MLPAAGLKNILALAHQLSGGFGKGLARAPECPPVLIARIGPARVAAYSLRGRERREGVAHSSGGRMYVSPSPPLSLRPGISWRRRTRLPKRRMCVSVAFWMMRPMDEDVFWRGTDVCVCVCMCVRVRVPGRPWPPCVCSALPPGDRQTGLSPLSSCGRCVQ